MMTDSMKPEDEVKVGLTEAPKDPDLEETICQLCGTKGLKIHLAAHWMVTCTYFHPKGLVTYE